MENIVILFVALITLLQVFETFFYIAYIIGWHSLASQSYITIDIKILQFISVSIYRFSSCVESANCLVCHLLVPSRGQTSGFHIKLSRGGFPQPSSTIGFFLQIMINQSIQNLGISDKLSQCFIFLPSLALCLAVAGCVSPFSGIFFLFTVTSRST